MWQGWITWGSAWELPALGPSHFVFLPAHPTQWDFSKDNGTTGLWEGKARGYHETTDGSVSNFIVSSPDPSARR